MLYRDERVRMMAAESVPQVPPAQAREIVEVCSNRLAPSAMNWHWGMARLLSIRIWYKHHRAACTLADSHRRCIPQDHLIQAI